MAAGGLTGGECPLVSPRLQPLQHILQSEVEDRFGTFCEQIRAVVDKAVTGRREDAGPSLTAKARMRCCSSLGSALNRLHVSQLGGCGRAAGLFRQSVFCGVGGDAGSTATAASPRDPLLPAAA